MSGRLLNSFALAALLVFACAWFAQADEHPTTIPYGPYGYSPGAYDYSYSTSSPSSSRSSRSQAGEYPTTIPYSRYGYTPGAYDYSYSTGSPSSRRSDSYGYSYPSYTYSYPSYAYSYRAPVIVGSTLVRAEPAQTYTYVEHRDGDNIGRVHVRVPANARVWVDGEATRQKGTDRDFMTPPLRSGSEFTYSIKAQWNQDGRNVERIRQVRVKANDTANVDFTAPKKEVERIIAK
jgi:uncharacterized protein (TIGR03000 family)